jgi:hypothetical protein
MTTNLEAFKAWLRPKMAPLLQDIYLEKTMPVKAIVVAHNWSNYGVDLLVHDISRREQTLKNAFREEVTAATQRWRSLWEEAQAEANAFGLSLQESTDAFRAVFNDNH